MRQIPYTMMKFAAFERTVEALYKYVVPMPRDSMSKPQQLVVTFSAGYIAGVFCALVSHPADSVVSKLNSEKGSTAVEVAKKLGWKGEGCCIIGAYNCIMLIIHYHLLCSMCRYVEGPWASYPHDWHTDGPSVVHL